MKIRTLLLLGMCSVPLSLLEIAPAPVQAATASGTFRVIWEDPPQGHGRSFNVLSNAQGFTHLNVDDRLLESLGGRYELNGKRVRITTAGSRAAGSTLDVQSIEVEAAEGEAAGVSGSLPFITLLCKFGGDSDEPHPPSWYDQIMGDNSQPIQYASVNDYWKAVSGWTSEPLGTIVGRIDLAGSEVSASWRFLPFGKSHYQDGSGGMDLDALRQDCIGVHDSTVNFSNFWGINMVFNRQLDCPGFDYCSWGGGADLTLDGVTRGWGTTWMSRDMYHHQFFAHETGHTFGLPHSNGQDSGPYASDWDVMSGGGNCNENVNPGGCVGVHTIAYHRKLAGWLQAGETFTPAPGTTTEVTLTPSKFIGGAGHEAIQIPRANPGTRFFYTFEYRNSSQAYDGSLPQADGIVIHDVDTMRDDPALVVDPDADGNPNDGSARWTPGETFVDSAAGITVEVLEVDKVRVTYSPPCP